MAAPEKPRAGPRTLAGATILQIVPALRKHGVSEAQVRTLARAVLEEFGYTVLAASHADEALQLSAQHDGAIDLLLTDIVTPGKSGRGPIKLILPMRMHQSCGSSSML